MGDISLGNSPPSIPEMVCKEGMLRHLGKKGFAIVRRECELDDVNSDTGLEGSEVCDMGRVGWWDAWVRGQQAGKD